MGDNIIYKVLGQNWIKGETSSHRKTLRPVTTATGWRHTEMLTASNHRMQPTSRELSEHPGNSADTRIS